MNASDSKEKTAETLFFPNLLTVNILL